ncbi:MAG: hypothetical protein QOD26_1958 [Betaproteobacteria bacterium]|jgi:hypothetical protein|nr:hypothetical protein [Betaproteobacteria bacterium]
MRILLPLLFLAGCSTTWDPHAPRTIVAPETGGEVTVKHGQRLQVKLPAVAQGNEWRPREPITVVVLAETYPEPDGLRMTPVRSGKETLRFEEVPVRGEGAPQRSVSFEVTVP